MKSVGPSLAALALALAPGAARAEDTAPLEPKWSPLVVPAGFLAPGVGHLLRGERKAGRSMLLLSGASFGLMGASGVFLGLSGASDVSAMIGVPIIVVCASTLLSLGVVDAVGTFAGDGAPPLADAWTSRFRLSASVAAPMGGARASPELRASFRGEHWLVQGGAGTTLGGEGPWVEAGAGARLWGYAEQQPRAGLWLEASARHDWLDQARVLRGRAQLVSVLPLGLFGARLQRVTSVLKLGVDPTWAWYGARPKADLEVLLSGGFEVQVTLTETLRLFGGYEHARDGLFGGLAVGFLGRFYAGQELALLPQLFLIGRAEGGSPNGFSLGLEWRQ